MKKSYFLFSIVIICLLVISQFAFPTPGFVTSAYACSTWEVGQRVALRGGSEIRQGSGLSYYVHTIVPEDNWQVDIIDGPRHTDGYTWWGISRKNLDGGGTGWVYIEQAGIDVCGNNNNPPPSNPPAGFSFCAEEGSYCSFSGTGDVAFGAQGSFYYRYSVSGGINCNNDTFGDPISGVHKACYFKQSSSSQPISPPSSSNPGDGTSWPQSTSIVLQWNSSSNATRYKVELWGGPYSTMTPCDWQSGTSCTIGTMWPGTMYWKVKARDNNGNESDWSSTWSFTIQEFQPTQQPPSNPQQPSSPTSTSQPPSNSTSNPQQPSNPQPPPGSNPPASNPDALQADACPGFVKEHIPGFTTPPTGRYIYVPADIDVLRLRQSPSTDTCSYGWLTPQNYYSVINERNDGWIQIETNVSQGWIIGQYVQLGTNQQQSLPSPDLNPAPESNPNESNQSEANTPSQGSNSAYTGLAGSDGSITDKSYDGTSHKIFASFIDEANCGNDTDYIATFDLLERPEWDNAPKSNIHIDSTSFLVKLALWFNHSAATILDDGTGFRDHIKLCLSNTIPIKPNANEVWIWLDQ